MNRKLIHTFLAANSSEGFKSVFEPFLHGKTVYIIKGGPGTGKSGFLKKISEKAVAKGLFTEQIHCSSDSDSLDGVYIPSHNVTFCDGTAPHILDPIYPGAEGGIINLGQYWNEKSLTANKYEIIRLNTSISQCYKTAYKFLSAAGQTYDMIGTYSSEYINKEKINSYLRRFIKNNIPQKKSEPGKVSDRFLSAYSPKGYITFKDTLYTLAKKTYVINDKYCISHILLKAIASAAVSNGYDVYVFRNTLITSNIDHIAIPELSLAIATQSPQKDFIPMNAQTISTERFTENDIFLVNEKLRFSRRILKMCIKGALSSIAEAKFFHDGLEKLYTPTMDFTKVDELAKETVKNIF